MQRGSCYQMQKNPYMTSGGFYIACQNHPTKHVCGLLESTNGVMRVARDIDPHIGLAKDGSF